MFQKIFKICRENDFILSDQKTALSWYQIFSRFTVVASGGLRSIAYNILIISILVINQSSQHFMMNAHSNFKN